MPNEPRLPQPPARHRTSPIWAKISLVLGAVLVVVSGSLFALAKAAENKVNAAIPDHRLAGAAGAVVQHAEIKGAKNILLASLDTRPSWSATHEPSHTDSIIILHVAADHQHAYMLSMPRDTLVDIPPVRQREVQECRASRQDQLGVRVRQHRARRGRRHHARHDAARRDDPAAVRHHPRRRRGHQLRRVHRTCRLGKVCMYVDENVTSIHIGHTADGKLAVPYTTTTAGTIQHHGRGRHPEQVQDRQPLLHPDRGARLRPPARPALPRTTATTAASGTSSSCSRRS